MGTKNPNVEKAAKVLLREISRPDRYAYSAEGEVHRYAEQLAAANLLVTPELLACGEACKEYARTWAIILPGTPQAAACYDAGRALIAAQEPDETPLQRVIRVWSSVPSGHKLPGELTDALNALSEVKP